MNMYLEEAKAIFDELVANRRYLHQHAEIKDDLPVTSSFVREKLTEYASLKKLLRPLTGKQVKTPAFWIW